MGKSEILCKQTPVIIHSSSISPLGTRNSQHLRCPLSSVSLAIKFLPLFTTTHIPHTWTEEIATSPRGPFRCSFYIPSPVCFSVAFEMGLRRLLSTTTDLMQTWFMVLTWAPLALLGEVAEFRDLIVQLSSSQPCANLIRFPSFPFPAFYFYLNISSRDPCLMSSPQSSSTPCVWHREDESESRAS